MITINSTGNELVRALSGNTHTENIMLQRGKISVDGNPMGPITTNSDFFHYCHNGKLLKFDGTTDKINSVTIEDGENLNIHCYADGEYIGLAESNFSIPEATTHIRFELTKSSNYIHDRILTVNITSMSDCAEYCFNDCEKLSAKFFSFSVDLHPLTASTDSTYDAPTRNCYDNGFVILPPNYSAHGKPVQLVVFCHGSLGFEFDETTPKLYYNLLKFIAMNGYAVADCSCLTNIYKNLSSDYRNSPMGMLCIKAMYEYLVNNYNIDTNGIYAFGKSAGGSTAYNLAYHQPIKVIAIGNLAPSTSVVGSSFRHMDKDPLNYALKMYGCPNPNVQASLSGTTDKQYVLDNVEKFVGWDPLTQGSTINLDTLTTTMYTHAWNQLDQADVWAVINSSHKWGGIPTKVWHATDDESVPYVLSQMFKKLIDNGNGIFVLRTLPEGTGGHHAVDTDANAPKTNYQTRYGEQVNIPVAYAELVDWFDRW